MKEEDLQDFYQDIDDINQTDVKSDLVVFSRDWTVSTILDQISKGNIDLSPGFQRRNAWNDEKRSKLIESILIGYPIPEIVLAECRERKNSFIVIDGKQRLLTIAGFKNPQIYDYWTKDMPKTKGLKSVLNGLSYVDIEANLDLLRDFENSALRCTVIANYKKEETLYDIFYRLNAGSTPLSSQELRQALNKGPFSDFLLEVTDEDNVLRHVMKIKGPDNRLRDVEVLLRCMSFIEYAKEYKGNLLVFLDEKTHLFNERWKTDKENIIALKDKVLETISNLTGVFGSEELVARKYKDGNFNPNFNRVLLEVLVYFFSMIQPSLLTQSNNARFVSLYKQLFEDNFMFRATIDGSTKNLENYKIRYSRIQDIVNESYGLSIKISDFEYVESKLGK